MLHKFHSFQNDVSSYSLPEKFTYPFYYTPHPIAKTAAKELQDYLTSTEWEHNFGLANNTSSPIGKMFGVLVVQNSDNEIGYLAAFSGKLGNRNQHDYFVPPVFDMLQKNEFFLIEEEQLNQLNEEIERLENDSQFLTLLQSFEKLKAKLSKEEERYREQMRAEKAKRKEMRIAQKKTLSPEEYEILLQQLAKQSIANKTKLKQIRRQNNEKLREKEQHVLTTQNRIQQLKEQRKKDSASLQNRLFQSYQFLNSSKERKDLLTIFKETAFKRPPAAAGECAAPKLLQYAFQNELTPVALAEFWWGAPPVSEIRKHKQFYPACLGKCKPILTHMLDGISLEENPLIKNLGEHKTIERLYEDEEVLIVNKPADLLSVPGKAIYDSVFARLKKQYPKAEGPLLVHRLDMSTSGILVIAKSEESYRFIQQQFIRQKVDKKYTAILDGELIQSEGIIDLPLAMDVLDRPRQKVDFNTGKSARTIWKKRAVENGKTRIELIPVTGRTHQLRVHCAHWKGLNIPIQGDDLYGVAADRLYLHATSISFVHPISKNKLTIDCPPPF